MKEPLFLTMKEASHLPKNNDFGLFNSVHFSKDVLKFENAKYIALFRGHAILVTKRQYIYENKEGYYYNFHLLAEDDDYFFLNDNKTNNGYITNSYNNCSDLGNLIRLFQSLKDWISDK